MLQQIYSGNCVPNLSESPEICRRYYKKTFWSLFPRPHCSVVCIGINFPVIVGLMVSVSQ